MKHYVTSVALLSSLILAGCGGSSGGGTPATQNSITVTSISVKMPEGCQGNTLYADSNIDPVFNEFGYWVAHTDGSAIVFNFNSFNPDESVTTDDIANQLGGSLNNKGSQIWYFLGGELNPQGVPDGVTHLYCKDSQGNHHEVSFSIDNGSGKQLSSNLILGTHINYDGPIQLVGALKQSHAGQHIYLQGTHAKSSYTLNSNNTL